MNTSLAMNACRQLGQQHDLVPLPDVEGTWYDLQQPSLPTFQTSGLPLLRKLKTANLPGWLLQAVCL
jgi:hypothetical protein